MKVANRFSRKKLFILVNFCLLTIIFSNSVSIDAFSNPISKLLAKTFDEPIVDGSITDEEWGKADSIEITLIRSFDYSESITLEMKALCNENFTIFFALIIPLISNDIYLSVISRTNLSEPFFNFETARWGSNHDAKSFYYNRNFNTTWAKDDHTINDDQFYPFCKDDDESGFSYGISFTETELLIEYSVTFNPGDTNDPLYFKGCRIQFQVILMSLESAFYYQLHFNTQECDYHLLRIGEVKSEVILISTLSILVVAITTTVILIKRKK